MLLVERDGGLRSWGMHRCGVQRRLWQLRWRPSQRVRDEHRHVQRQLRNLRSGVRPRFDLRQWVVRGDRCTATDRAALDGNRYIATTHATLGARDGL